MGQKIYKAALLVLMVGSLSGISLAQKRNETAHDAVQRGNQLYANANYKLAIAEYGKVSMDAGDNYARALYNIGVCYYELWKTEEAIEYYRRAIQASDGRYPAAQHALGVALKDLGRLPEAKQAFERAVATSQGNFAPSHYLLGLLAMDQADHERAVSSFRNAVRSKPFPAAHNNLGVALARLNRLSEAKLEFEIAVSQADGEFLEASQNLKLCNSLLARTTKNVSELRVVDGRGSLIK